MLKTVFTTLILVSASVIASDKASIQTMLDNFLVNADKIEAHQNFWAEDLVYTSSTGKRFGKNDIISSFNAAPATEEPMATYSADQVDIRVYADTAVLAFRLIGAKENMPNDYYFNTGTLLKRGDNWQVVAWQATKTESKD